MNLVITKRISMESKYLDNNIVKHFKTKLNKMLVGDCSLENGYVIAINKILSIEDNIPSRFAVNV